MELIVRHPAQRVPERLYIYDVVLRDFLGLSYAAEPYEGAEVRIRVRGDDSRELAIPDTMLRCPAEQWLTAESLPPLPLAWWRLAPGVLRMGVSQRMPILYGKPATNSADYFTQSGDAARLGLDVFGSAFFMLTRYEEIVVGDRDQCDRFPAAAAIAVKQGFLDRPIVNDYVDVLWWALQRCWPHLVRRDRNYRVFLTHDVDDVSTLGRPAHTIFRSMAADLVLRREPKLAVRKACAWIATNAQSKMIDSDPYNTFDFIMKTSESLGIRSSFYIVPGHSHRFDPRYRLDQDWICRLLRRIHGRGHELGYHASYNTYKDPNRTRAECDYLRQVLRENGINHEIRGGRQHYLRWENPTTWQNWEDVHLEYDSTLTYAQQAGFRCGCCYEYPVWNLRRRERLTLRERPLVAMESSLLSYEKLPLVRTEQKLQQLITTCRRYDGDFTLLWHNTMLIGKASRAAYSRIANAAVGGPSRSQGYAEDIIACQNH